MKFINTPLKTTSNDYYYLSEEECKMGLFKPEYFCTFYGLSN